MGKHTPGPWRFRPVTAQNGGPFTALLLESQAPNLPANDPCVLAVREDWVGYLIRSEKGQANAALIASAPELLQIVKDAQHLLSKIPDDQKRQWSSSEGLNTRMLAAIAKAEGGGE